MKRKLILTLICVGLLLLLGTALAVIYYQNSIQNNVTVNDYHVVLSELFIDWGTVNPNTNVSHEITMTYHGNLASVFVYWNSDISARLGYLTCDKPQGYELVKDVSANYLFTLHIDEHAIGDFAFNINIDVGDS